MSRAAAVSKPAKTSRSSKATPSSKSKPKPLVSNSYLQRSQFPLYCLVFLLPLMACYEIGTRLFDDRIYAANLMMRFFQLVGATGRTMPALAVVSILLAWHIARKDEWKIDVNVISGMLAESVILAVPLVLIGLLLARYIPLFGENIHNSLGNWIKLCILSMGAGIYEELVFRLIGFTLLTLLLIDGLKMSKWGGNLLIVFLSALIFSHYHYWGGMETFQLRSFVFRTIAGIYFGVIFWTRGFGITAVCHVVYDIFIVTLQSLR